MLKSTFINDKNKQIDTYTAERISEYNQKMNANYEYEEHLEKHWTKKDVSKLIIDSLIGLVGIILMTMLVAAFRFYFFAKVDTKYLLQYTLEYPKLVAFKIFLVWILWTVIHTLYRAVSDRKVEYEYFTPEQFKGLQRRNKRNRTNAYEGLTSDDTSERYKDIKVVGYIRKGAKFKERTDRDEAGNLVVNVDTDVLEISTGHYNDNNEELIERYNIKTGKKGGKVIGYIKVDEDKYVAIVEHHVYPFVIAGLSSAVIVTGIVTSDIRPAAEGDGNVAVSETMQKLEDMVEPENTYETEYVWLPGFSDAITINEINTSVPLRNFSENQFRDEMWTLADDFREALKKEPDRYTREQLRQKFNVTYLTLTNEEVENCLDYIWGITDEKKRETYENEFSFLYDVIIDKADISAVYDDMYKVAEDGKVHVRGVPTEQIEKCSSDMVCLYSTYPKLLPPGTVDYFNAYEMFKENGDYKLRLRIVPFRTRDLDVGSPRDVIVNIKVRKGGETTVSNLVPAAE